MIPDIELVLTAYLKAQTAERVVGTTPSDISTPWVRLTQLDASNEANSTPEHLIDFLVQFDCYAGEHETTAAGQAEASEIARSVRAALAEMKDIDDGIHDGATITDVRFVGMPRIPDTSIEPARERFILTAHFYAHA